MNEDLEMYLLRVARQLRGLPPQQREAELREIESHLRTMIEAREVAGVLYSDAVDESLRQFGNPQSVGRKLTCAWRKHQSESPLRILAAALSAVACQVGTSGAVMGVYLIIVTRVMHDGDDISGLLSCAQWVFLAMLYGVAPLLGGYSAKRIAPRRGVCAAYAAYVLLMNYVSFVDSYQSIGAIAVATLGTLPGLLVGAWFSERKRANSSEFSNHTRLA